MEFRKRLLVVVMALSLIVIFDVFVNGSLIVSRMADSLVRTTPAEAGPGISEFAPFISKRGAFAEPAAGIRRVRIVGADDVQVTRAVAEEISIEFLLRTYAISSRHAEAYQDQVDVNVERSGDLLVITLLRPDPNAELYGVRSTYLLRAPDGIHLEFDDVTGSIDLHRITGPLTVNNARGALTVTEHVGDVTVTGSTGWTWLAGVKGDISLHHRGGYMELIGIDGDVTAVGEGASLLVENVNGSLSGRVERGMGLVYSVTGDVSLDVSMTHVSADNVGGTTTINGVLSPIELGASLGPAQLSSERGNVRWRLGTATHAAFDIEVRGGDIKGDYEVEFESEARGVKRAVGSVGSAENEMRLRVVGADFWIEQ